jgi:RNA polymerase sigma-70 factor (ECF subfamily)
VPLTPDDIIQRYNRDAESILLFLARRTHDPEAAVDILAETFAAAFEDREQFRGDGEQAARAWLYGIARHQLTDYFRRERVALTAVTRLGIDRRALTDDEYERIEELAGSQELRDCVAELVDGLPDDQRHAVRLRVVNDENYASLAQKLGISQDTARARVSRGLRTLRAAIDHATTDTHSHLERSTNHV